MNSEDLNPEIKKWLKGKSDEEICAVIDWLDDYCDRWDRSMEIGRKLIRGELRKYLSERNLPQWSADELACELRGAV